MLLVATGCGGGDASNGRPPKEMEIIARNAVQALINDEWQSFLDTAIAEDRPLFDFARRDWQDLVNAPCRIADTSSEVGGRRHIRPRYRQL
jgi:hypothetical protein